MVTVDGGGRVHGADGAFTTGGIEVPGNIVESSTSIRQRGHKIKCFQSLT
jgi:hypothetical protein